MLYIHQQNHAEWVKLRTGEINVRPNKRSVRHYQPIADSSEPLRLLGGVSALIPGPDTEALFGPQFWPHESRLAKFPGDLHHILSESDKKHQTLSDTLIYWCSKGFFFPSFLFFAIFETNVWLTKITPEFLILNKAGNSNKWILMNSMSVSGRSDIALSWAHLATS